MTGQPVTIVLVEDNDLDVEKIERSFRKLRISNPLVRARDGIEALALLRSEDGLSAPQKPYVILLDLNMPRMNGIEFLQELRADARLSDTPVFVLTTSDHKADIVAAYSENVSGYIVKPVEREQFLECLGALNLYWSLNEFPD